MTSETIPSLSVSALDSDRAQPVWRTSLFDRLTCALAASLALAVYLATMPPGVTGEDSGELIAAAWTLGIPHPPGYPLWCLLAYPVVHLVEIGSVAWRANFASALFGAAGVWLVAETVLTIFGRRWTAFAAALALGFSREYWQQALIAEVYTLGGALVAAHLLCVARWTQSRDPRTLYVAGFFAGLAGAHYSLNLALPPMLFVLFFVMDLSPRRWRRYGWLLLWSLSGSLMYLYLPIRSGADPAMDWGNPESWAGFWDVTLRRQYSDLVVSGPWRWGENLRNITIYLNQLLFEFTPLIGILSFFGMAIWVLLAAVFIKDDKHKRFADMPTALYLAALFVILSAGVVLIPNYPPEYQWDWLRSAYFLPIDIIIALALAAHLVWFATGSRWVYGLLGVVSIALPLAFNSTHNSRHGDRIAEAYGDTLLSGMLPDAIYFGGGDHTIFPAVYLHIVEGERPDVILADRYGYPAPEVYALVSESAPDRRPSEAEEQRLFNAVLSQTSRPVYSAVPRIAPAGSTRVNESLLYRYLRDGETPHAAPPIEVPEAAFDTRGEWSNELIVHDYLAARGRGLFDAGRPAEALAALDQASDYVHGDKHALNNLGLNAAEGGQVEAASVYFQRALDSDPLFLPAALNLARCFLMQGTPDEALEIVNRLEAAGLGDPALEQMKHAAQAALEDASAAR